MRRITGARDELTVSLYGALGVVVLAFAAGWLVGIWQSVRW